MIRTMTTLLALLSVIGCSRPKTIPAPTENWDYVYIHGFDETKDAELCLLISYELQGVGDVGLQTIFFKKALRSPADSKSIVMPNMFFADGDDWSSGGSYKIKVHQTNLTIVLNQYYMSDDVEYELKEDLHVSYSKTGSSSSGKMSCEWEWIELNDSNGWDSLSEKTSVDWLKILSEESESGVK